MLLFKIKQEINIILKIDFYKLIQNINNLTFS